MCKWTTLAALLIAVLPLVAQQGGTGTLKTKVDPGRAGVFINGKYVGPAANFRFARKYSLPAGEHEVTLSEPRYEDVTTKVTITAGQTTVLRQTMKALPRPQPPYGRLFTKGGDHFSAVFLNGKFMGHVDEFDNCCEALLVNPGEYAVKIVSPSGDTVDEQKVTITAGQETLVRVK